MLTREKRSVYYTSKFIAVFFSGFITIFCILSFSLIITMMFYPLLPPEAITANFPASLGNSMFKELFIDHPMIYTLLYIVIDSTFFGAIALISDENKISLVIHHPLTAETRQRVRFVLPQWCIQPPSPQPVEKKE